MPKYFDSNAQESTPNAVGIQKRYYQLWPTTATAPKLLSYNSTMQAFMSNHVQSSKHPVPLQCWASTTDHCARPYAIFSWIHWWVGVVCDVMLYKSTHCRLSVYFQFKFLLITADSKWTKNKMYLIVTYTLTILLNWDHIIQPPRRYWQIR